MTEEAGKNESKEIKIFAIDKLPKDIILSSMQVLSDLKSNYNYTR